MDVDDNDDHTCPLAPRKRFLCLVSFRRNVEVTSRRWHSFGLLKLTDPVPATTPAARPQPIFRPLSIMEPPAPPKPGPDPAPIQQPVQQQPVQQQPAQQGIAAQQGVAALLGAAAMLPLLPPAPPPEQQVGFLMFNAVPVVQQKERHGNRGKYKACRKPRACGQCRKYAKVERYQDECPGAQYRQDCVFFPPPVPAPQPPRAPRRRRWRPAVACFVFFP